jgi:hypothetical protein
MAAPSTTNVAAAKPKVGGGIYRAALNTPLPTTASIALDAAFLAGALGYIGPDGLVPTREVSIEKMRAWGGDTVANLETDSSSSFAFTLLEVFQQAVNEFVYGTANVTWTARVAGTSPSKFTALDKGTKPVNCAFVFEMFHGNKKMRIVVAIADPSITGEAPMVDGGLQGYEVNVEALKDASGVRVYRYFENDDQ